MNEQPRAHPFRPDFAIPPGRQIQEYLDTLRISARELARRCGRSPKLMTEIIQGKAPIEPETALQLERVLGLSASIWLGLEADYRLRLAREQEEQTLTAWHEWLASFPIKALQQRRLISTTGDRSQQILELLRFFGVGSVPAFRTRCAELMEADFRTSPTFASSFEALVTWLRVGELKAAEINAKDYNRSLFLEALRRIRPLTRCPVPTAIPVIQEYCAEAGVCFVIEKPFDKVSASGVSRWLSTNCALIQQSFRYGSDDHFWFTFFHEAAHLLLHSRKSLYIDEPKGTGNAEPHQEREANEWAAEFLVPQNELMRFMMHSKGRYSEGDIISFAQACDIAPGIVVGQLQHRGALPFSRMNDLKKRYDWCEIERVVS